MPIKKKLIEAIALLKTNTSIKTPALDAEILFCFALKISKEQLYTHPKTKLSIGQSTKINSLIKARLKGTPIAYIIGYKEFYGLHFIVNKHTLIPRPETELIIDEIKLLNPQSPSTIIDIGTGSGCIIITLVKILYSQNIQFIATDISKNALKIAEQNSILHKLNNTIQFKEGNLLDPIINPPSSSLNSSIIITANLPYLTPTQVKNSPSIQLEPKTALISGKNGLDHYRELFKQINQLIITKNTSSFSIFCEIDPTQAQIIKDLANTQLPANSLKIKKDLSGLNRLLIINI